MKKSFASIWWRIAAFAFDYLVIAVYLVVLVLLGWSSRFAFPTAMTFMFSQRVSAQFVGFLLITLPVTLYFAFGESSLKQASWGKQRMGLKVVNVQGRQLSFIHALARNLLKFVPWELAHTCIWSLAFSYGNPPLWINAGFIAVYLLVGMNLLSIFFSKTHQSLYDFATSTYVVKS